MTYDQETNESQYPWWFVRGGLLATLGALVGVLVFIVTRPEVVDRGLRIAGL